MTTLQTLLQRSAVSHGHLCPRQVLGVRMGLLGGLWLGIPLPQADKRLLTFVETNGCGSDGIGVATGCQVGRRTMHVLDYGKLAATFIDTDTERAIRITPRLAGRKRAAFYAPEATTSWEAQLLGYQRMPDIELLTVQEVALNFSLEKWLSKPGLRVICANCGEEIMNEREVWHDGELVCRPCAGERYYEITQDLEQDNQKKWIKA